MVAEPRPSRLVPVAVTVACAALVAAVAVADARSAPGLDLTLLYLVPVGLGTFLAGRGTGLGLALLATASGLEAARLSPTPLPGPVLAWNAAQQLGVFLTVALVLDAFGRRLLRERQAACTDPVTSLANRRALVEAARVELARCRRHARPLSLLYLDCDDFKRVNDRLGHPGGDSLLAATGAVLTGEVRTVDTVARLGGDEFVVLLPEVGADGARALAERLRRALRDALEARFPGTTFSIGVATFDRPPGSVDEILLRADALMYDAKRSGKDCWRARTFGGEGP